MKMRTEVEEVKSDTASAMINKVNIWSRKKMGSPVLVVSAGNSESRCEHDGDYESTHESEWTSSVFGPFFTNFHHLHMAFTEYLTGLLTQPLELQLEQMETLPWRRKNNTSSCCRHHDRSAKKTKPEPSTAVTHCRSRRKKKMTLWPRVPLQPRQKTTLWPRVITGAKRSLLLASPQYTSVLKSKQNYENNRGQKPLLH